MQDAESQEDYWVTDPQRIGSILTALRGTRCDLDVKFEQLGKSSQTQVLKVETGKRQFLIGSLTTRADNSLMQEGEVFHLHAYLDGADIHINDCHVASVISRQISEEQYCIDFPKELQHIEQRTWYRAPVRALDNLPIRVTLGKAKPRKGKRHSNELEGWVIDASLGGCQVLIKEVAEAPHFEPSSLRPESIRLHLDLEGKAGTLPATLLRQRYDAKNRELILAFAFGDVDESFGDALSRYINRLQIMARRSLNSV